MLFRSVINLSGKKSLAFIYDSSYGAHTAYFEESSLLLPLLEERYEVTKVDVNGKTAADLNIVKDFDMLFVTEALKGAHAFGVALKDMVGVIPMVNTKAYFYTVSGRWGWAAPQNPNPATGVMTLTAEGMVHPLFDGVIFNEGTGECVLFDNTTSKNQLQSWTASEGNVIFNDVVLSTAGTNNCVHEHVTEGSDVKYVLLPFSSDDFANISENGVKLLLNGCEYVCPSEFTGEDFTPTKVETTSVAKAIVSVEYYNISGMKTPAPVQGINIVKTTFEDGSVEATKVIIK